MNYSNWKFGQVLMKSLCVGNLVTYEYCLGQLSCWGRTDDKQRGGLTVGTNEEEN
jgi:hypothetical protein